MVSFILNDILIETDKSVGMTLLDYIRYEADLKATKVGCREGDCGACTVLGGSLDGNKLRYHTIVSCLTPLGNIHGKHIVTVEGINLKKLSPVQEAIVEHNGTQCGFCTPGFVMSLTSFLLSGKTPTIDNAVASIDGNICRCTGYKSIERAAKELVEIKQKTGNKDPIIRLIKNGYLPTYFQGIQKRMSEIKVPEIETGNNFVIGGGTDLMVQQADTILEKDLDFYFRKKAATAIELKDGYCTIRAATAAAEIMESAELQAYFPKLIAHFKLISSTQIRNMGSIAGNFVNASPIGDLSIFFLALNADVFLIDSSGNKRLVQLKDFFLGYKKINKSENELIEKIGFRLPEKNSLFNFEKVSKRQFLDIASVNSAISFKLIGNKIDRVHLSAGGVSPIPLFLKNTSAFLNGKEVSVKIIYEANVILQEEISPISDIRGSIEYKRLLIRQLFYAHFAVLFSNKISLVELLDIFQV